MPRKKSGLYDNKSYQNEYHKAMKTKLISFNPNSPEDMRLWDYLQTKDNQTGYIKRLIREDISGNQAKDYGATYDYMRDDFTDGKADVCERICQALMKNGVLVVSRTDHHDRVRFKWLLRGEKQKEQE